MTPGDVDDLLSGYPDVLTVRDLATIYRRAPVTIYEQIKAGLFTEALLHPPTPLRFSKIAIRRLLINVAVGPRRHLSSHRRLA